MNRSATYWKSAEGRLWVRAHMHELFEELVELGRGIFAETAVHR